YSNIVALGAAWQRGLVPVSLEALLRAVELNGVAVENNKLALSLGRLAVGDPQATASFLVQPAGEVPAHESLDALIARGVAHLTAYQDAAYAARFADFVARVRAGERALGADASLPFSRTVAQSLLKLMAFKDEYEVARLYTDGEFQRTLQQQFEGDIALEFYMAPPIFSKSKQ